MKILYRTLARGLCGVGMADGLYSIYHTNPPCELPRSLDILEAKKIDAQALSGDCLQVMLDIGSAYEKEIGALNVQQGRS